MPPVPGVSRAGLAADTNAPSQRLSCSARLGWTDVLVRTYREPDVAEEFTAGPSPELLLVVQQTGRSRIESRRHGGWAGTEYHPGSMGVTAPRRAPMLRWRPVGDPTPVTTLQIRLAAGLLAHTADALGRPRAVDDLPDALALDDPVVLTTARALGTAAARRASPLVAAGLTQALAAQLLAHAGPVGSPAVGALDGAALARVVAHMRDHLDGEVTLDGLAAQAHLSKFHFLRAFRAATGTTPHRYLIRMRMQRAGQLLRTGRYTVAEVAQRCGYAGSGHFSAAFRRHTGVTPDRYRHM